jgi:hypothetical protein
LKLWYEKEGERARGRGRERERKRNKEKERERDIKREINIFLICFIFQYNLPTTPQAPTLQVPPTSPIPPLALRILEATDCLIGDEQLLFLVRAMTSLGQLSLGSSLYGSFDRLKKTNVSTRGLFALFEHCPLESIYVVASSNIHFRYPLTLSLTYPYLTSLTPFLLFP